MEIEDVGVNVLGFSEGFFWYVVWLVTYSYQSEDAAAMLCLQSCLLGADDRKYWT